MASPQTVGGDVIRIMHVDDDPDVLMFSKTFLEEADAAFRITSVKNPLDALSMLDEGFDCFLLDYKMPGMMGTELAGRLRASLDTPIILYTGQGSEEVAEEAFKVGVNDYKRKEIDPSHYQVLARSIRGLVESRRMEEIMKRNEYLLKRFYESATEGFVILDKDLRYVMANDAHLARAGAGMKDLRGRPITEVFPDIAVKGRDKLYKEVIETGKPFELHDVQVVEQVSGLRTVHIKAFPVFDGVGIFTFDVTESRRFEEAVRVQRDVALASSRASTVEGFIDEVLPMITRLTEYDCGGLYLVDRATGDLDLVFHRGLPEEFVKTAAHYKRGTPQYDLAMRGEPMHIKYDLLKSIEPEEHKREGLRAISLLPIRYRGEVVAELNLASHKMDEIPRSSQVGIEVVAAQMGPALGRILGESRLRGQLEVIRGVTPRLFAAGSAEEVYEMAIEAMERELGILACSVAVLEGDSLRFMRIASRYVEVVARGFSLPLRGKGIVPRAAREKATVLVEDIRLEPDYVAPESVGSGVPEMRSELAVPVVVGGRVVAVLNQEAVVAKAFTDVDRLVLEMLAGQVALALGRIGV